MITLFARHWDGVPVLVAAQPTARGSSPTGMFEERKGESRHAEVSEVDVRLESHWQFCPNRP